MKLTRSFLCVAVAGAITFVMNAAPAQTILMPLSLSGKILVNTNDAVTKGSKVTLTPTKGKFNEKDLVALLNASPLFDSYVNCYTEGQLTNLPPKTTFAYDPYSYEIFAVLPTGGIIAMQGLDCDDNYFYFMDMDFDNMSASYSYSTAFLNGKETDQCSRWFIEIDDYNTPETYLYLEGEMDLTWAAGKVSGGYRTLSVKGKFTGSGTVEWKGYFGTGTGKAGGKGSAAAVFYTYWPFWYNWGN